MEYTYVLLSERDGRVRSTAYRRPLKLIYYEACVHLADARRRERFLKTGKGKQYLYNRLKDSLNMILPNTLERH